MRTAQRQRGSLVWLAILTIAAVGVVRAEGSWPGPGPAPYTQSMLRFLASHQDSDAIAAAVPGVLERWSAGFAARAQRSASLHQGADLWSVMLPVVFVGLAAPINLSGRVIQTAPKRVAIAQFLPSCFNRPPPALRA